MRNFNNQPPLPSTFLLENTRVGGPGDPSLWHGTCHYFLQWNPAPPGLDLGDGKEASYEKRIYSKVRSYSLGADQRIHYRRSRPDDGRRSGTIGSTERADGDGTAGRIRSTGAA